MILIWKPRYLNAWQMPPFIGKNSELLIWWLIVEWVATSWLGNTSYLLVCRKCIANIRNWTNSLHESSGKLSQLSNVKRIGAFGLLELEIWAKHWTDIMGTCSSSPIILPMMSPFAKALGTTPKTWLPPKNAAIDTPFINPRLPPPYTK